MIQEINASKLIEDKINSEQKNKIKKVFPFRSSVNQISKQTNNYNLRILTNNNK